MAPARIERRTWISPEGFCSIVRLYYICTTCDNGKLNVFRDSTYPRGFIIWDDSIGIHPLNPRCYCGFESRQDRKGEKARVRRFGEGFWICATGAFEYFSDRKDGVPYRRQGSFLTISMISILICWRGAALLLSTRVAAGRGGASKFPVVGEWLARSFHFPCTFPPQNGFSKRLNIFLHILSSSYSRIIAHLKNSYSKFYSLLFISGHT